MKTIHKFPLQLTDWQEIMMPEGAGVLTIQVQKGVPALWCMVDTSASMKPRHFITRGTGHPVPDGWVAYVGTYQLRGGDLVFHVMEVT